MEASGKNGKKPLKIQKKYKNLNRSFHNFISELGMASAHCIIRVMLVF